MVYSNQPSAAAAASATVTAPSIVSAKPAQVNTRTANPAPTKMAVRPGETSGRTDAQTALGATQAADEGKGHAFSYGPAEDHGEDGR